MAISRSVSTSCRCWPSPSSTNYGKACSGGCRLLLGSAGMVGARQVERVAAWLAEAVKADRRAELESGRMVLAEALQRFEDELERRLDTLTRQVSGRRPEDF